MATGMRSTQSRCNWEFGTGWEANNQITRPPDDMVATGKSKQKLSESKQTKNNHQGVHIDQEIKCSLKSTLQGADFSRRSDSAWQLARNRHEADLTGSLGRGEKPTIRVLDDQTTRWRLAIVESEAVRWGTTQDCTAARVAVSSGTTPTQLGHKRSKNGRREE